VIPRVARRAAGGALFIFLVGHGIHGGRAFAYEATTQVTVIRPMGGDAGLVEIATRAWAELNAGGIAASLLDCFAEVDSCRAGSPPQVNVITLRTFRQSEETITEAALTPAGRDRPTVRRSLTVSEADAADPKVMAIRAVELVNAMLLQVDTAEAEAALAARLAAVADPEYPGQHLMVEREREMVDRASRWSVGAGGSFLKGNGGFGAAVGFAVRASYRIQEGIGVSAFLTEAPSVAGTATINGRLSTNQQLAALEFTYRVYENRHLSAHLAFGGGGYHLGASWTGSPSMLAATGLPSSVWALLLSGGCGGALLLGREMSLFMEARAMLAVPNPFVYTADGRLLQTADPSLLLSLGVQKTF